MSDRSSDRVIDGWESWGRHILSELERLNTNVESLRVEMEKSRHDVDENISGVKEEIAVIKIDCVNCKKDMTNHINSIGWWRNGIIANIIAVLVIFVGFIGTWSVLKYRVDQIEHHIKRSIDVKAIPIADGIIKK